MQKDSKVHISAVPVAKPQQQPAMQHLQATASSVSLNDDSQFSSPRGGVTQAQPLSLCDLQTR